MAEISKRKNIDWAELVERTRNAEKAVVEAGTVLTEQRERILRARARLVAVPLSTGEDTDAAQTIVVFRSGAGGYYALPLSEVVEVIRKPQVVPVPRAPSFVAGVMQVRGEIRPVYHLTPLLGRETDLVSVPQMALLLRAAASEFAIGVDSVEDIRQVASNTRIVTQVMPGHAGWMTSDLIPCLTANTLIPENNQ